MDEPIVVNIHGDNNFVIAAARNARVTVHRGVDVTDSSSHNIGKLSPSNIDIVSQGPSSV